MKRAARSRKKVSYKDESSDEDSDSNSDASDYEQPPPKRKRVAKGSNKSSARGKRSNSAKKSRVNQNEDELPPNFLFQSLSSPEVDVSDVVLEWLDQFETDEANDENESITVLINFVLRCCGSLQLFQPHDLLNLESAADTVGELSLAFSEQQSHKYPFKTLAPFKNNVLQFFVRLVELGHERGLLYKYEEEEEEEQEEKEEDESSVDSLTSPLMLQIITWLGTLSSCTIRPLRATATSILLSVLEQLCRVMKTNVTSLNKSQKQLSKLQNKSTSKYKNLLKTLQSYHKQKDTITEYFDEIASITLGHRYRDVDPLIRQECVKYLSQAMIIYPDYFLDAKFLRYFGWLLSDPNNGVRVEISKVLVKLYKSASANSMTTGLGQFTERYKQQIIKMTRIDSDAIVRLNLVSICCELAKFGFFDEEDNLSVIGNFFQIVSKDDHKSPSTANIKIKSEFAKFTSMLNLQYSNEERERYGIFIENYKSSEVGDDDDSSLSLKSIFKYKSLINLLQNAWDKCTSPTHNKVTEVENISIIFHSLYQLPIYDNDWEFLMKYYLFDTSSIKFHAINENLSEGNQEIEKFKEYLELNEDEKSYLLKFIYGSFSQMYRNGTSKMKDSLSSSILVKLANDLPKLAAISIKSNILICTFLQLWILLISSNEVSTNIYAIFDSLNQISEYESINISLIKSFEEYDLSTENGVQLSKLYQQYFGKLLESYSGNTSVTSILSSNLRLEIQDSIQNLSAEVSEQLKVIGNETSDEVDTQKAVLEKVITIGPTLYKLQVLGEQVDINEFINQPNSKSIFELLVFKIFNRLDFEVIFTSWANNFLKVSDMFIDSFCKTLDLVLVGTSWKLENLVSYDESNQKFYDIEAILDDDSTIVNQLLRMSESLAMATKYITETRGTSQSVTTSTSCGKLMHLLNDMKTLIAAKVIDLTTSIKIFYVKFKNSNSFKNFDEFFSDLNFGKYVNQTLSEKIQSELLDIFLYKETRLGKLLNIEIERADDENVHYDDIVEAVEEDSEVTNESRFESEDEIEEDEGNESTKIDKIDKRQKVWDQEKSLCVYTLKLISLLETSMVNDTMFERLKLNSEKLGVVYKTIIQQHIDSMEKYNNEKDGDRQGPSGADGSENEMEDVTETNENRNDNENTTTEQSDQ